MSAERITARGRTLERARPTDIPSIVAIETQPAMDAFIGAWTAERHRRQLDDAAYRYYVVRDDAGNVDGFAIVYAYAPKFRWFELCRIAVREPGGGRGADVLDAVLGATFSHQHAHRIQLDVYPDNLRAQRAYARAGFRIEGLMRDAVVRGGRWQSLVLMALLEDEWVRFEPAAAEHAYAATAREVRDVR